MLESLKEKFHLNEQKSSELSKEQKNQFVLLAAILMLEMAGADNDFAPEEIKACFSTLDKYFGLNDSEALSLLEKAESTRKNKEETTELLSYVNTELNEEMRIFLLSLIWKVVVSDQKIEKFEIRFANQLRVRLQLSEEQAEEARKLAFTGQV